MASAARSGGAGGAAALTDMVALSRAREAGARFQRALTPTDLHRPAGRALRLLADVDISFSRNCCSQIFGGGRWSLGRSAPMPDVGFAGSGRRRWCRRRSSAASYRVIDNDRQIPQHRQWWRSTSLAQRRGRCGSKDQRNLAALTDMVALSRAREAGADSSEL